MISPLLGISHLQKFVLASLCSLFRTSNFHPQPNFLFTSSLREEKQNAPPQKKDGKDSAVTIHTLAKAGDVDQISQLTRRECEHVHIRDKKLQTALHVATENEHAVVAKLLIEHGAAVDARDTAAFGCAKWAHRRHRTPARCGS